MDLSVHVLCRYCNSASAMLPTVCTVTVLCLVLQAWYIVIGRDHFPLYVFISF